MLQLTKAAIACAACPRDFGTGDGLLRIGTDRWPHDWIPPRGWAGAAELGHRPIVTVSLNPGHPLSSELDKYARAGVQPAASAADVTDEAAAALLSFCNEFYDDPTRSKDHVYPKKVVGYVRAAAWLLRIADQALTFDPRTVPWQRLAWITDCFKCSTVRDSGPRIPFELKQQCVERHLLRELAAASPRLVLALGGEASSVLCEKGIKHVKMRHPSNGCPRLDAPYHDDSFARMANELRLPLSIATSEEFRDFRRSVQKALFG
jgi:hypothetical protein